MPKKPRIKSSKKIRSVFTTLIVVAFLPFVSIVFLNALVLADEIESTNYKIRGDDLSGVSGTGTSTNYGMTGDVNPFSDLSDSTSFRQESGYNPRLQANTPYPPTLQNFESYYDRLLIMIDTADNPTDTLFAVAISYDDFASFQYVQSDGTVGGVLGMEDYRNYVSWGGVSGSFILGLNQNTAYKVRAKALQGDFTETGYSSDSNEVSTTVPFINMSVSTSGLSFGTLNANSVSKTSAATVSVNTNSYSGYQVYVNDQGNGASPGLYNGVSNLIPSIDQTLTSGFEGYGAQASSISATVDVKYDVSGNNVGGLTIGTSALFSNTTAVTDENADVLFKATMAPSTTAGMYSDVIYYTVTPNL